MSTHDVTDLIGAQADDYEFHSDNDPTFDSLGRFMREVGGFYALVGVLSCIAGARGALAGRLGGFLLVATALGYTFHGLRTRRAGTSFRAVSATSGRDVVNVLDALDDVQAAQWTLGAAYIIAIAPMLLGV